MLSVPESLAPSPLISGGGIAGLTLGILLKERGWNPLVIEREPSPRSAGYMMDFFGTGWDVAERMGLTEALRAIRYPIDSLQYVDNRGVPFLTVPIDRVRRALDDRYVYLLRSDLERVLLDRARHAGLHIRFGTSIASLSDNGDHVHVTFESGQTARADLLIGADGVHSRVRELAFGPETSFSRYLGSYVAAFHAPLDPQVGRSVTLHEEPGRISTFYHLDDNQMDAMLLFRDEDRGSVPAEDRLPRLRRRFDNTPWITSKVLRDLTEREHAPLFFDSLTQIVMPHWSTGRTCLIGDACGCLTLAAGQGSHMAMAGAYVLATELARNRTDHRAAFEAYEKFLKPHVDRKQAAAARLASRFVPSDRSRMWLRRLVVRAMFSRLLLPLFIRLEGSRSVLRGYGD
jgi:2-polyprenyl-6-methoxyphenol hydroxylase-like FAD-dependent oxidoreductase